jgi:phosphopantothenoylcysteine decarboxylase/phosphopantothenate--cysteine ligase
MQGKHILLGITGSIAGYKAVDLASKLTKAGAIVDVVLTSSAAKFVSPISFSSVTGRKAYTDEDLWGGEGHVVHISLGRAADLIVIVPASANTLAKLANGFGDNLLTVTTLASHCPLVVVPAMDVGMYGQPVTQNNVSKLEERGVFFIGPETGHLASGLTGLGRMTEPEDIFAHLRYICAQSGPLSGKKIVVTAGGTQEPIDPVRYITNRSSGKQGYAIAQAAIDAGAQVTLITTPTHLKPPAGALILPVRTAQDMADTVFSVSNNVDALIMAAAVADFRPKFSVDHKIKKDSGSSDLALERTTDILAELAEMPSDNRPKYVIGFAAESENLIENAQKKLQKKKLDLIVANNIMAADAGFQTDTNRVTFLFSDGKTETLPIMEKTEVAERIIDLLKECL